MATAESTIDDPVSGNNSDSVDTTVQAVADLEVVSTEVVGVPAEALIGADIAVTVRSTVRNLGPSAPIDAELETTGTPPAGASVSPALHVAAVNALELNALRVVEQSFTLRCEGPGLQEVVFDAEIRPANAEDTDPTAANNLG